MNLKDKESKMTQKNPNQFNDISFHTFQIQHIFSYWSFVSLYKAFLLIDRELSGCPQWEVLQLLMGLVTGESTSVKWDICLDKIILAHNPNPDGTDI